MKSKIENIEIPLNNGYNVRKATEHLVGHLEILTQEMTSLYDMIIDAVALLDTNPTREQLFETIENLFVVGIGEDDWWSYYNDSDFSFLSKRYNELNELYGKCDKCGCNCKC